uniref:SnogY n=1 Tax=Streptomyces nogalater TaxID=38314 RepID=O54261_STRNO|nr:SnogY [Streptomyces nogalater]
MAGVLLAEVAFRCPPPVNTLPVHVGLDLEHDGAVRRSALRLVRDEPVTVHPRPQEGTPTLLRFSLADLVRRLFGPEEAGQGGDFHNEFLPQPPGAENMMETWSAVSHATHTVMTALSTLTPDLGELAVRYGSDKWASFHWYTPHYDHHFRPLRNTPVRVLEIGVGGYEEYDGGGSLKMWKRYFRRGLIHGLDIVDKTRLSEPRLTVLTGDQNDPETLERIVREHGPFDVVIDDGSHVNQHVHTSFRTLFPHLRSGGLYVIEDLQTSYWPEFGGTDGPNAAPDTSLGLVKQLLDDLHHQERPKDRDTADATRSTVTGVHVYHNIAFVTKGVNGEAPLPDWMLQGH